MIVLANNITLPEKEIELNPVRAQGAGGQNVNKVSSAIHLRFDIHHSSLPDAIKQRLLQLNDSRITKEGIVIIKSQEFRTQELNRGAAIERLAQLINSVLVQRKKRIATRPGPRAKRKRLDSKTRQGQTKKLRNKPGEHD